MEKCQVPGIHRSIGGSRLGARGLWQGEVRARGGTNNVAAPWTAKRTDE